MGSLPYNKDRDKFIGQTFGKENQVTVLQRTSKKSGNYFLYEVFCQKCHEDAELFGEAKFYITKQHLLSGILPCGCGKRRNWSKDQYEIRCRRKCKEHNFTFNHFEEYWENIDTKLSVTCQEGHTWWISIDNLLRGKRCPSCAKFGFKKNKPAWIYLLKVLGKQEFAGFGITNNLEQRIKAHKAKLLQHECVIDELESFIFEDGSLALNIETKLKNNFTITPIK